MYFAGMKTKTVVLIAVLAASALLGSAKVLRHDRQKLALNAYFELQDWRTETIARSQRIDSALQKVMAALSAHDSFFDSVLDWAKYRLPAGVRQMLPEPVSADILRLNAASLAGRLGAGAKPAVPLLAQLLKDNDADANAAISLGELGPDAQSAIPALLVASREHRVFAATALSRVAPFSAETFATLKALARSGPEWQRIECTQALQRMSRAGAPLAQNF